MNVNRAGELLLANKACGLFFDDLPDYDETDGLK
jgi:hypothetical protein